MFAYYSFILSPAFVNVGYYLVYYSTVAPLWGFKAPWAVGLFNSSNLIYNSLSNFYYSFIILSDA